MYEQLLWFVTNCETKTLHQVTLTGILTLYQIIADIPFYTQKTMCCIYSVHYSFFSVSDILNGRLPGIVSCYKTVIEYFNACIHISRLSETALFTCK